MKIFKLQIAMPFFVTLILMLTTGCGQAAAAKQFGEAIDPNAPKVTLTELVAKPEAYEGKMVVVEGQFAGACGDGDIFFKDKFDMIEADPPNSKVCLLKKGTPIRLYGLVKVHRTEAEEANEKNEGSEKREKGEAYVRIVAKGVEVK